MQSTYLVLVKMNSHRTHWQDDLCLKLDVHHFLIATSLLPMVLNLTEVFWSDYCSMALCRVFRQMIHEIHTHTHTHTHINTHTHTHTHIHTHYTLFHTHHFIRCTTDLQTYLIVPSTSTQSSAELNHQVWRRNEVEWRRHCIALI